MPGWIKGLLIAVGCLVALLAIVVGGVTWWAMSNKDKFAQIGTQATQEGRAFASTTDGEGCVTEALRRLDGASSIFDEVSHKLFLTTCLEAARIPAEFCKDVPAVGELLGTITWAQKRCQGLGSKSPESCARLMSVLPMRCQTLR